MINLRNSPFLWFALLLLFAFSIYRLYREVFHQINPILPGTVCLISALIAMVKYQPGSQIRSTLAIALLLTTGGMIRISQFESGCFPGPPLEAMIRMKGLVEVTEVLKEKESSRTLRCIAIHLVATGKKDIPVFTDKYLVVQIKEADPEKVLPGDRLAIEGWVSAIKGPLNPHAFDIRRYYQSIGIRHQLFCKGPEVSRVEGKKNSLLRITAKWQSFLCGIVREHTSPPVAQLTNALVWGDRTYMDEEIRDAFANSGAMHVLSVSGMHMAIVYSMLYLLLGAPGSGTFYRRMARLTVYTLAIILYMGLTGACPAVVRSGLMILLFLLGKAMGWNTQIWNLLGFAGFMMLWMNPFVMFNIGFQLSFLAMAGILLYAKPIIRYFSFRQILLHRVWEVTAVSVAAQVFIFPLLLFHFYQFPLTFVASSLVAMPASYIVIFGSLLNICFSGLEWPWHWQIYDVACHWFILIMKWMAGLNPEMNYSLPLIANVLLSGMAILFSVALVYRWRPGKRMAYVLGLAAFINLAWHRKVQWNSNELTIYHQYQGLLIDVMVDGRCIAIHDSLLSARSIDFAARGNRCFKDVIEVQDLLKTNGIVTHSWAYHPPLLKLPDQNILIWTRQTSLHKHDGQCSHILIDQCPDIRRLKNFLCDHPAIMVILPAHLDKLTKNSLVRFLKENDIGFHDISEQGYFSLPL